MSGLDTKKDRELLKKAQAGDMRAFEALYHAYQPRIYRVLYGIVGNAPDAADLTQETFVRAFGELERLRSDGNLYGWLRKTAYHLGIDQLRRRKVVAMVSIDSSMENEDGEPFVLEIADKHQDLQSQLEMESAHDALQKAVCHLSVDHRAVVVMHYMEEMSVEEIAAVLEVPIGTVKSRLSRARDVLRERLLPYI